LIPRACGDTVLGEGGKETLDFMFARQVVRRGLEVVKCHRVPMQKKLTGWLILLIVLLVLSLGAAGSAALRIDQEFKSLLARYPSLRSAIMALKFSNGAMVCASLYTAWVLYRMQPGTLRHAQAGLAVRFLCVAVGSFSFPLLAGLPSEMTASLMHQATYNVVGSMAFTSVWLLYLIRSARVREIYDA
jgi:hypothetical protein